MEQKIERMKALVAMLNDAAKALLSGRPGDHEQL